MNARKFILDVAPVIVDEINDEVPMTRKQLQECVRVVGRILQEHLRMHGVELITDDKGG